VGDLPAEFRDQSTAVAADWLSALEQEAERRLARGQTGISMIWSAVRAHADLEALQRTAAGASRRPTC